MKLDHLMNTEKNGFIGAFGLKNTQEAYDFEKTRQETLKKQTS